MMSYEKKITTIYLLEDKLKFLKRYAKLNDMHFTQLVNVMLNEGVRKRIANNEICRELQDNAYYQFMKENM